MAKLLTIALGCLFIFLPTAYAQAPQKDVITLPLTIEEKIAAAFPDAPIMLWVARAEVGDGKGGIYCHQKNPGSSATGCFQILTGTWELLDCVGNVWNEDDNIACARRIYDDAGLDPWNASRHVWGKHLKDIHG